MASSETRQMLGLAVPIVVVQVGMMAMGVVDTLMVGHVSAAALAAVALGNLYVFGLLMFGMGVVMALDPVIAQAVGAQEEEAVARGVQRGLLIAALVSVPTSLLLVPGEFFLTLFRQPTEVVPMAADYARVSIPGVFPFLAFVVLRQSLQAMGRVTPIVGTIVGANLANLVLNWMLIFGNLGCPALGAVGSAWATSASRWLMAVGLLVAARRELAQVLVPVRKEALRREPLLRMLRLGAPIGFQFQIEIGAFGVIALLMGYLGTREMAAHQVAINLASLTFMVPLGVSAAAAVRVGHAVGRADLPAARRSARVALGCGAVFMASSAAVFLAAPGGLARLYTDEAAVGAVAAALIPIAGFFQVLDGLQVVAAGVLRGLGDTRAPMLLNVLGFWLIGMPVSLYLAFRAHAGPEGLWWGLVAGLAAVALLLLVRVRVLLRRPLSRVVIDEKRDALATVAME